MLNGNSNVVWLSVKSSQMENLLFMDLIYRQRTNFPLNEVCLKLHLTCKITSFHAFACGIKYHSGILLFGYHDYKKAGLADGSSQRVGANWLFHIQAIRLIRFAHREHSPGSHVTLSLCLRNNLNRDS